MRRCPPLALPSRSFAWVDCNIDNEAELKEVQHACNPRRSPRRRTRAAGRPPAPSSWTLSVHTLASIATYLVPPSSGPP